jgi:hypothetical protein
MPSSRRLRRSRPRRLSFALWLPLTPILALLAPVALAGAAIAEVSRIGRRASPVRMTWATGALLMSLSGAVIAVDAPGVRVRLRIF